MAERTGTGGECLRARRPGRREPSGGERAFGHSQGGNNVVDMARELAPHNVRVDLLITLVPFLQDPLHGI
jgi:hypothetical protein